MYPINEQDNDIRFVGQALLLAVRAAAQRARGRESQWAVVSYWTMARTDKHLVECFC